MLKKIEDHPLIDQIKNQPRMFFFIILWAIYWEMTMGFYNLILSHFDIDHLRNYHLTMLYFLSATSVAIIILKTVKRYEHHHFRPSQLLFIAFSLVVFYFLSLGISSLMPIPPKNLDHIMEIKFYYPLLRHETILTKAADIIFQQTLILSLLLYLEEKIKGKKNVILAFTVIFFFIHVPLFTIFGWLSLAFTIPSLGAGIIFSYLILSFNLGLFYSFVTHQAFYLVIAMAMRSTLFL